MYDVNFLTANEIEQSLISQGLTIQDNVNLCRTVTRSNKNLILKYIKTTHYNQIGLNALSDNELMNAFLSDTIIDDLLDEAVCYFDYMNDTSPPPHHKTF